MKYAWVRIASSVRTSAASHLKSNGAHRHPCTLEAMRTQAFSEAERLLKHAVDEGAPIFIERLVRREGFSRLPVPVTRVRFVAFLAMQIGMNAGSRFCLDVLNDLVRGVPT